MSLKKLNSNINSASNNLIDIENEEEEDDGEKEIKEKIQDQS